MNMNKISIRKALCLLALAPAALLGALVPGVLGILAAVMSIPDRARWAEEEWYVEEEK